MFCSDIWFDLIQFPNYDKTQQMLKRLSYPLSWVEGLTGEAAAPGSQSDSLPTSADSHNTSMFSKVFNRYVLKPLVDRNLVSSWSLRGDKTALRVTVASGVGSSLVQTKSNYVEDFSRVAAVTLRTLSATLLTTSIEFIADVTPRTRFWSAPVLTVALAQRQRRSNAALTLR